MTAWQVVAQRGDVPPGELREIEVGGERILLVHRTDGSLHAVGALCTHFGLPLAKGLVNGDRLICPFHHAAFDVTTGAQLEPPGCGGLTRYEVKTEGENILLGRSEPPTLPRTNGAVDERVFVLVGAGAVGRLAAVTLRDEGFTGRIVMVAADDGPPYDRTLLSKAYLKGTDLPRGLTLDEPERLAALGVELMHHTVARVEHEAKRLHFTDDTTLGYDACLLAPGSAANMLGLPGNDLAGVHVLHTKAETDALLADLPDATRAVVIGGGFIGLEGAASLRGRGLDVSVVVREEEPFTPILGARVGSALRRAHEAEGLNFLLNAEATAFHGEGRVQRVELNDGSTLDADVVLVGVGVRPVTDMLHGIDLAEDGGVPVGADLRLADDLYVGGDIAQFPDPVSGGNVRIEHWRVAAQHGVIAARNMLGGRASTTERVPFFWTAQQGQYRYVGHAPGFDDIVYDGAPEDGTFIAYYVKDDRVMAALGLKRDKDMAAIEELMRLKRMPAAANLTGFDPVKTLQPAAV